MDDEPFLMLLIGGFAVFMITLVIIIDKHKTKRTAEQKSSLATRNDFNAEVIHGASFGNFGVAIDSTKQKFAILGAGPEPKIFDFSQLVAVDLQRDGQTLAKTNRGSQAAGAAVGAVLLGPAGLLLGGLSGSKTSVETIRKLALTIYVSDFTQPAYEISFFQHLGSGGAKPSDLTMQMAELNAWYGRFKTILAMGSSQPGQMAG
ncbi:hypothetical protein NOJ05_19635 [Neorhizobium galegae]|uniref:hypothetical protein n=1 Tax=Neorhizobium galegae TaxID=399 RepID=UPI0021055C62|nr:hypothetical protein [Neorhizobium galegae]MCQ1779424.1 hypothetical protein [Neorhizobium galegae]MCQ1795584.1 hypothetical protein [Neorhizobium galegae]